VEQGEVRQVVEDPAHPYTQLLVNSQPGRRQLRGGWTEASSVRQPLLSVEGLQVAFPGKRDLTDILRGRTPAPFKALDGIDFAVTAGESVGIVG
ncbi:ABC transporter ATP-binding protein, partial [Rhizobiaceae sp. 2RAB30]